MTSTAVFDTSELADSVTIYNAFIVTNTATTGVGSLENAIIEANETGPGPNTIDFQIPSNGSITGPYEITLSSATGALSPITSPVFIDGSSETRYLEGLEERSCCRHN